MKWFVLLLLATAVLDVRAAPVDVLGSAAPADAVSLEGPWAFRYVASSAVGADESFFDPAFDTQGWAKLGVPGHWELHGFAEPQYKKVDEGTGLYRRTFDVPAAWRDGRLLLRFEGVLYGFTVWVNGRCVGEWASSYNPVTFDITDFVRRDAPNVLAVRVTTRSKGWEFDTNDCWALSGIYREVTLFRVPEAHLRDCTVRTTLRPDRAVELRLSVCGSGAGTVAARLARPDGQLEREVSFPTGADGRGEVTLVVAQPQLWTAETPWLYRLDLQFSAAGGAPHRVTQRIGLREVTIDHGVLKLNGTPIKLRGVDHHDLWPDEGRVATEALIRRDLELMRGANINFIRTSHYPPHPRLIELCDEMGFYVMCEVPFGFGDKNLTDPSFAPVLRTRARATVQRDKNHPSVIVWSIGNENPLTELGVQTAGYTRELDPTRPVCFPTVGSYFAAHVDQFIALPGFVGIFSPHYPGKERVLDYARRLERPLIFTEFSHALGLAFDGAEDLWPLFEQEPRVAGGAVWMFQDQGLRRSVAQTGQPKDGALYVWPDAAHYFDTAGTDGCDGIVYSDRTPQVDYWQLRKIYAPVRVVERALSVAPGMRSVALQIQNHYDFRSLAGLTLRWTLKLNGTIAQQGQLPLHAPPRGRESLVVPVAVPENSAGEFCWLELVCCDEQGRALTEHTVRLQPARPLALPAERLGLPASALELQRAGATSIVRHAAFTLSLNHETGALAVTSPDGRVLLQGIGPHAARRFTMAEMLRANRPRREGTESALRDGVASIWSGVSSLPVEVRLAEAVRLGENVRVTVRGRYPRIEKPTEALEGEVSLEAQPDGRLHVRYAFRAVNATGTLLETGLALAVPSEFTVFRWIGAGPFAGYPGKQALNEFGVHQLRRGDIRFPGNRREVEIAALTDDRGVGVALFGPGMDVAPEVTDAGTILSHNARVAGRGNKGGSPEVQIKASSLGEIRGEFTLLPLAARWTEPLRRWLGPIDAAAAVQAPFLRSYDQ